MYLLSNGCLVVAKIIVPFILFQFNKDKMTKGCGGGSDACRSLAAYGTATKAGQMPTIASTPKAPTLLIFLQSPSTFPSLRHLIVYRFRLKSLHNLRVL